MFLLTKLVNKNINFVTLSIKKRRLKLNLWQKIFRCLFRKNSNKLSSTLFQQQGTPKEKSVDKFSEN